MTVILISGKATSGKNTFATFFGEYLKKKGVKYQEIAFATPLKQICRASGWNGKKDKEGRKMLQDTADNIKAIYGDDYFALKAKESISEDVVLVTDWRYKKEYEVMKEFNVVTVRIEREVERDEHSSETELDDFNFDFVIKNRRFFKAKIRFWYGRKIKKRCLL